jgi:hypothetical protein
VGAANFIAPAASLKILAMPIRTGLPFDALVITATIYDLGKMSPYADD